MLRCRRAAASVAGLSETRNTTRQSAACFAAMRTASRTACGGRSAVCFRKSDGSSSRSDPSSRPPPPELSSQVIPSRRAPRTERSPCCRSACSAFSALSMRHTACSRAAFPSGVGSAGARCALSFCTISVWKMPWCTLIAQGQGGGSRTPLAP